MNIKEMLESGVSPEDLRKKLEEEIESAEASLREDIDKVRYNLIDAVVAYMKAMNWIEEDISEEDKKEFVNVLKDTEDELGMYAEIIKVMMKRAEKAEKEETSDDIIRKFLKGL